nr:hypothetical protein [Tanacetum cinerariifolium]
VQEQFDAEKAKEENVQQYVLFPVWSSGSTNPQNTDGDVAFDEKDPEFKGRKPQFEVYVSPSSSAQSKKHDDKTKREAKGKSHVESLAGYRNLSVEFQDFFDDNINEVNATDSPVPAVGKISTNNTNPFSVAGPSNVAFSLTHGKSSLIPPTRVHKDHPVIQIIGDLSSATQTRRHTQEEEIDYEEVFALVARIEAIRLYLGFEDPDYPEKVFKVVKALYGLHQAPRAWYETLASYLLENDGKSASTPIDTKKPLLKDPDGEDVDLHTYRSIIGSLMYLTSSRPDIMFVVCACAHFQVTPKASHLHAVKRIFRYLKGKPHLGLWYPYPKDSPFNLVAYSDSDYAVVATSSIEAEYVAAASCCAQVIWIQNQLLDYGKMVIIIEATIRDALWLDDAEGIECLPNEEIFTKLERMGYEKPLTKLTFYKVFFLS